MKKLAALLVVLFLFVGFEMHAQKGMNYKLVGTWQLTHTGTGQMDSSMYRIGHIHCKTITPTNFMVFDLNPKDSTLFCAFYGTYTIVNNVYTEYLDYVEPSLMSFKAVKNTFKIKLKDNILYFHGTNNDFDEVWKRVDPK